MTRTKPERLSPKAIDSQLAQLVGWHRTPAGIERELEFPDFIHAFGFMTQVALMAQARDHHPDWRNVYGRVWITLTTHEAGGITERDLALAREIASLSS